MTARSADSPRGLVTAIILTCALSFVSALPARAGDHRPLIFEPVPTAELQRFYSNGRPFAVAQMESARVMIAMDRAELVNVDYIVLWCLYQNLGSQPVLLDPVGTSSLVTISIKPRSSGDRPPSADTVAPTLPSKLERSISSEKAAAQILLVIGGALGGMATGPTTARSEGKTSDGASSWTTTTTIDDRGDKQRANAAATAGQLAATSEAYDLYARSISMGILRKNSVFPGQSVNGYIYFRLAHQSGIDWNHLRHTATLRLPTGNLTVEFLPSRGD